jgi:tetratricopeptide (TPR) repeat protein
VKHAAFTGILVLFLCLVSGTAFARDLRYELLQAKQWDQAIAECTRRIDFGEGDRVDTAYSYWARGHAHLRKGENEQALADYGRAIELDPTPDRYYERGELYQSMLHYKEAVVDYLKAAELYEASHNAQKDRYNAQMARMSAKTAKQHEKWDTWFAALVLCVIPGYLVFSSLRSSKRAGRKTKPAWIIFLLSVTLFPFLLVQGVDRFGWPLRFMSIIQFALVAGFGVAGLCGAIALFSAIWEKRKRSLRLLPPEPAQPKEDENSREETPIMPPRGKWRFCPSCGAAVMEMKDVWFCPNCGASLDGLGARKSNPAGDGGGS